MPELHGGYVLRNGESLAPLVPAYGSPQSLRLAMFLGSVPPQSIE
jgi:hypothetical protein